MKCDRFWDEITDLLPDYLENRKTIPEKLRSHMDLCPKCQKEFEIICKGFSELKEEIHMEEGASFWKGMGEEVKRQVTVHRPHPFFSSFSRFFSHRSLGWVAAVMVLCLFVLKGFSPQAPRLTRQDLVSLFGSEPMESIYEDSGSNGSAIEQDEPDPYIYSGITDSWTSILSATFEDAADTEKCLWKRRKNNENSVSCSFYGLDNLVVWVHYTGSRARTRLPRMCSLQGLGARTFQRYRSLDWRALESKLPLRREKA